MPRKQDDRAGIKAGQSLGPIVHPYCVACSSANARGLKLQFIRTGARTVEAAFDCPCDWEGYPGIVHGGMVALILDSAMTNCLFASGKIAMTAELTIRYHTPVRTGRRATVRAEIRRSTARLYLLNASIMQDGHARVTASGKFLMAPP